MNSKVKILFAALVFVCLSIHAQGDGTLSEVTVKGSKVTVCSLNRLKSNTVTVPLSSLVENCTLVQLETNKDAYFKPWFTTVTDKYIGVRQQGGNPYKLFDRSGKFLCDVGSIGQGPGEYSIALYDDLIDDKSGLIYLASMTGDKILVYNVSGKFVKNIIAPHKLKKPKLYLSNNILTVVHMAFNGDKAIAIQFDVNTGKVLQELAPPTQFLVQNFDGEIFNTRNVPMIFDFLHTSSDTLYHFDSKGNMIIPFFTMTFNSSEKPWKQYYQLNKDLLLTNVFGKGLVATDLKNKTSSWIKVANDYYGNMPMPAGIVQFRNCYFVHNIQPEELMSEIEKRLAVSSCTEKDKQILKKTLLTLKENDNNVVFIGKLKSEVKTKLF